MLLMRSYFNCFYPVAVKVQPVLQLQDGEVVIVEGRPVVLRVVINVEHLSQGDGVVVEDVGDG